MKLLKNGSPVQPGLTLSRNAPSLQLGNLTLAQGSYQLVVEAAVIGIFGDIDDFSIGMVRVRANKAVRIGT